MRRLTFACMLSSRQRRRNAKLLESGLLLDTRHDELPAERAYRDKKAPYKALFNELKRSFFPGGINLSPLLFAG